VKLPAIAHNTNNNSLLKFNTGIKPFKVIPLALADAAGVIKSLRHKTFRLHNGVLQMSLPNVADEAITANDTLTVLALSQG